MSDQQDQRIDSDRRGVIDLELKHINSTLDEMKLMLKESIRNNVIEIASLRKELNDLNIRLHAVQVIASDHKKIIDKVVWGVIGSIGLAVLALVIKTH